MSEAGAPPESGEQADIRRVAAMADGITATVRTARGLADGDRPIDLAGLDNMVGVLCAQVLDLPLEQGRPFCAVLRGLDQELALLRGALADGDPV